LEVPAEDCVVEAAEPFFIFGLDPHGEFLFGVLFWFAVDEVVIGLYEILHHFVVVVIGSDMQEGALF
jgi:hypothetical protein